MSDRFSLLYRFSTDYGLTWVDLTPQVDSRQTVITQNLCTNNFTSAKDEATFVMPETPLYDADGNATPKKLLMDALMGDDDILVEINAPGPVDVLWKGDDVLWKGFHVQWRGSVRYFTGYADRSSMNLRSYPLPPRLTVKVQDVSVLHLDDKVNDDILLENKRISEIVAALLAHAGYVSVGSTALEAADDETLEAFVIDKDGSRTYRQYIDDLLFEAGGYVLDFNESGQANVVHLQWDGSASASRTIDNPMNADGVTLRSAWLKEDGVKVTWSSLAWAANTRIWQADISQDSEGGVLTGQKVQAGHYWPENGELDPVYMEYDAKLLDSDYLTRASRRENKDLTVIMAKNMSARIDAMQGNSKFTAWTRPDPVSWPAGDNWKDKYGIPSNPAYWPTKAWHLLYNGSGSDVTLTFFSIYGDVLYRSKVNTVEMAGSQNPKEYESIYIYNQAHAERFAQFWWHFLQTSRYQFTWSEPNRRSALNDVVSVGVKGNGSTQKALIAGKTSKWINDNVEVISYTAVGIDTYSPASLIPVSILPSTSVPAASVPKGPVEAKFPTTPSHTLAEWESSYSGSSIWTVTNASDFSVGDIALIRGVISDMGDNPVNLYISVSAVSGTAITGTGVNLVYTPVTWDFEMSQSSVARNDRLTGSYTDITLTAITPGYTIIPSWTASAGTLLSATGMEVVLRVPADVSAESITVTMSDGNTTSVSKNITVVNQTVYDHDFGAWEPTGIYDLPDHYTEDGVDYDVIPGDFFVAKKTFTVGGQTYTKGVPYMYQNNSWHNAISATTDNTERLLRSLGSILNSGTAVPSSSVALYGWFGNLVAQDGVIANLFSQAITVLSGGYIKGGDRYSNSGAISDWTKDGFWFGANGKLMASLQSDGNGNTYVGTSVGANSNSPGSYNTAMGYAAMFKTTSGGDYNIALGYTALHENQTGDNNVAIGYQALYYNTASDNIGIGTNALVYNTSGTYGVAIGANALYSNTNGNYNVGIGYEASKNNTTGSYNLSIGYQALYSNTSGSYNIALGVNSLLRNSSGARNIGIGSSCLYSNQTGGTNISIGHASLYQNTSGSSNIGTGVEALSNNTSGGGNIGIGYMSLYSNTTGNYNIGIGHLANCYSTTGSRQININDALIGLEFNAGRTYAQVYTVLKTYLTNTSPKVTCIGVVEGDYASRIEVVDSTTIRVYGAQYHNFTNSSSTLTKRMVLFFVNPQLSSDTYLGDCLT